MRIIGFSEKWIKLNKDRFTTFRFPRKDKDWYCNENVQVFYKPRSKQRELLGHAQIVRKQQLEVKNIDTPEAIEDGFINSQDMINWLQSTYPKDADLLERKINKLTLEWIVS